MGQEAGRLIWLAGRGAGEGSIYWYEKRGHWVATASLGYHPAGKRVRKFA